MLTRLIALLVLSGALGVLGQDAPEPTTRLGVPVFHSHHRDLTLADAQVRST
jgi:hypothetical protein